MASLERTDKPVRVLIQEYNDGVLGCPEIQRDYVWGPSKARDLVDSLFRNYPSGLILLWKPRTNPIKLRNKANTNKNTDYLILDGQQRIVSLQKVFSSEILIHFHILDGAFQVSKKKPPSQYWVTLKSVIENPFDVLIEAKNTLNLTAEDKSLIEKNIQNLNKIGDYLFPVIIMHTDDYEEITESFIRLNSKGTRLKKTELAMARLAYHWPGAIVNEFDNALTEYKRIGYDLEASLLMRCFLTVGKAKGGNIDNLSLMWNLERKELVEIWRKTKSSLNHTINFLKNNAGIDSTKWLGSDSTIIPLVYFFFKKEKQKISEQEISGLLFWFFINNIHGRYTGRISNIDRDIKAISTEKAIFNLIENLKSDISAFNITPEMIKGVYYRSSIRSIMYAVAINSGAKDWFTGTPITNNIGSESQIEQHHVFPVNLLKKHGYPSDTIDDIANIAFLSQKANRNISDSDPAFYLSTIDTARLESQFIPTHKELWKIPKYNLFCEERRKLIAKEINNFLDNHLKKAIG